MTEIVLRPSGGAPYHVLAPSETLPHAEPPHGWRRYVFSTDHKVIGLQYLITGLAMALIAGLLAYGFRMQLAFPGKPVPGIGVVGPARYNEFVTMHGTIMIFWVAMPVLVAAFGNLLIPLMVGTEDMAFPRLNMVSYWVFLGSAVLLIASFFVPGGAFGGGWTAYPPLSAGGYGAPKALLAGLGGDLWILAVALEFVAFLMGGINFLVTTFNMRAPGMSLFRMPLALWMFAIAVLIFMFSVGPLIAGAVMLLSDRVAGTGFYNPAAGGDPILFQHLFWFFGHPEVYIMVLPGFGIISEVLPVFARKPIFGYKAIAASTVGIAFLGFLTWAHHMFTAPIPEAILVFVMLSSYLIAVPTGVKILNWVATLWRGTIEFKTPLLFAAGAVGIFLIGGISGVFLATFPIDWQVNETYFVVAHLHFVLLGGAVLPIFAGIYYWFPKMSGRMLNETLGKLSFWLMFFGILITFMIQHAMGLEGMPRRIYEYDNVGHLALYNIISTVGAFILASGVLVTIINVWRSLKVGTVAGPDPWKANTLEWFTDSPPPVNNFDVVPVVRSAEPMKDIRREVERRTTGAGAGVATVPAGATQVGP